MKTFTVSNIQMQFDTDWNVEDREHVTDVLDAFSKTLQDIYPGMSPVIFTSSIDNADIEVKPLEETEL